jgi:hypothetical protein
MHRLGTQHCAAMGSPPIPGRSVRSAPDTASMTEPLVIDRTLRQCRLAGHRRHGAEPGPRGGHPGRLPAREGSRSDHPPRPDRRRRPHRPPRQGTPHPPPAPTLASRAGMAEPLARLRPAAGCGLTSPDRSAPARPKGHSDPRPRPRNLWTRRRTVSGRQNMPENSSWRGATGNVNMGHPGNLGGSETWEDAGPWWHSGSILTSCPQLRRPAATGPTVEGLSPHSNRQRLTAHVDPGLVPQSGDVTLRQVNLRPVCRTVPVPCVRARAGVASGLPGVRKVCRFDQAHAAGPGVGTSDRAPAGLKDPTGLEGVQVWAFSAGSGG